MNSGPRENPEPGFQHISSLKNCHIKATFSEMQMQFFYDGVLYFVRRTSQMVLGAAFFFFFLHKNSNSIPSQNLRHLSSFRCRIPLQGLWWVLGEKKVWKFRYRNFMFVDLNYTFQSFLTLRPFLQRMLSVCVQNPILMNNALITFFSSLARDV